MNSTSHPFILTIVISVAIWSALYNAIAHRLRTKHPASIEGMKSWGLFKFIALREHRSLNDRRLSLLSDIALAYSVPYLAFFAYLVLYFPKLAA